MARIDHHHAMLGSFNGRVMRTFTRDQGLDAGRFRFTKCFGGSTGTGADGPAACVMPLGQFAGLRAPTMPSGE